MHKLGSLGALPGLNSKAAPASTGSLTSLGSLAPLSRLGSITPVINTAVQNTARTRKRRLKAVRFALQYEPPAIALCYIDQKYTGKQRVKRMPLPEIQPELSARDCTQQLIQSYPAYLAQHLLSHEQLQRLVSKILLVYRANQQARLADNSNSLDALYGNDAADAADGEDLNRVDDSVLRAKKNEMNAKFVKQQLKPGDAGFQYDKRVEFQGQTRHCATQNAEQNALAIQLVRIQVQRRIDVLI